MPTPSPWHAYILRCADGSLYTGVSNDVRRRVAAHNAGRGARYTRVRRPVVLAWRSPPLAKSPAHRLEWRIKQLPRAAKQLLLAPACVQRRRLRHRLLDGLR